ncbi:unnamed protein product [Heligmosomoides polygyrus]|uniref:Phosphatidylglycerophosphatase and protein-tyrosine phosphatase 1 n=1 Tax=Heligmosomoides polygyrus TaxID=6339 RepID=A0A183F818_HELPZ|nr:unnamed protein product [Heligmosomoides polygyrus]
MFSNIAFYPSLGYNLLRNYLQPRKWAWYNRVDDTLLVGAMPFKSMEEELVQKENVGGVVCCVEDFEMKYAYNAIRKEDWQAAGVAVHEIPMADFVGSAARPQIDAAVHFIEGVAAKGKSVYIHCKAGRTRSATVAVCYLMKSRNWLPNVAVEFLKSKRPQVRENAILCRVAEKFEKFFKVFQQYEKTT